MKDIILKRREVMKSHFGEMDDIVSDQELGKPLPLLEKPCSENATIIDLPKTDNLFQGKTDLTTAFQNRQSHRKFKNTSLTLEELSFLLRSTQGIKKIIYQDKQPYCTLRIVPSAGARHPFETYLLIHNVQDLVPGIYRYLPIKHQLCFLFSPDNLKSAILEATLEQRFSAECSVVFVWSCIPYRAEWRYSIAAHKAMLLDAGHICQNLYLACEVIQAGTCAIAAYSQEKMDELLKLDGIEEFSVYLSPVGKV
jgi:SagB-type dehydrogenase family enzyme